MQQLCATVAHTGGPMLGQSFSGAWDTVRSGEYGEYTVGTLEYTVRTGEYEEYSVRNTHS